MRICLILLALAVSLQSASAQRLPPDFVYLRDIDPSIAQDMRYASANNFTGHPLPGYGGAECVLRRDAALALKRVQASLTASHLSLKVYDCYRPQRAVNAMAHWAAAREDDKTKRFYPTLEKRTLFAGWIAQRSMHSAGTAVDLTVIPAGSSAAAYDPAARYGPCSGAAAQRAPDNSLDMGTSFDCFDPKSFTRSSEASAAERERRAILLAALSRHGFKNYFREWWHFAFSGGAEPVTYDVPIAPR
jgi:D-alanyl-D-alanine dipeptidase